jgi:carboxypeptidase A2/carboxypeptidase A1
MTFRIPPRLIVVALVLPLFAAASIARAQAPRQPPAPPAPERFDGYQHLRVRVESVRDLRTLASLGAIEAACHGAGIGPSDFIVPPGAAALLDAAGIAYSVLNPNIQHAIDAERAAYDRARAAADAAGAWDLGAAGLRGPDWFSTYHPYDEISDFINALVQAYPALASRFSVGPSLQQRDIFGIRLRAGPPGDRPQVLLNSMQHAREWAAGSSTLWIARTLLAGYGSDPDATRLLDSFEFLIVPVVNPDGYVFSWTTTRLWRKNRRDNGNGTFGVDTNRNWGFQWGGEGSSGTTSSETYRGPAPFSEPETQALRDFVLANPRILLHVDVHTFSQFMLSPWGWTGALHPDQSLYATLNAGMKAAAESVAGSLFSAGPSYITIYPASGVMPDWVAGAAARLSWTYELRDRGEFGFVLPPEQIVPTAQEAWAAVRWASLWLLDHSLFISFAEGDPASVRAGTSTAIDFDVRRAALDPDPDSVRLYWRRGRAAPFQQAPLSTLAPGSFRATINPGPCNSVVQFFIEASTTSGLPVSYPAAGAAAPIEAVVRQFSPAFADDAEIDRGWSLGVPGDTATAGQWVRGNPVGTSAQPEDAHSGLNCFFTGQGVPGGQPGAADVDNGFTTLLSPAINLAGAADARVSYWRWYVNNTQGNYTRDDVLTVQVSADNGATWTDAEIVGPNGLGTQGGWEFASWYLSRLSPPVSPSAAVRLRFIAADIGTQQILEAAVDDVLVEAIACAGAPCPGDWDRDGAVLPADLAAFVNAWIADLAAGTLVTDTDASGDVTPADVAAFVAAWFASVSGAC